MIENKEPLKSPLLDTNVDKTPRSNFKLIAILIPALYCLNVALYVLVIQNPPPLATLLLGLTLVFLLGGIAVGFIISLIPYRKMPYGKRFFRSFLIAVFIIEALAFVLLLVLGLFTAAQHI